MNERIRELAKQAGIKITPMIVDDIEYEYEDVEMDGSEDLAKFAELIVQECVQTLIDKTPEWYTNESAEEDWDKGYDRAMKDCVHHIKEHFGVSND